MTCSLLGYEYDILSQIYILKLLQTCILKYTELYVVAFQVKLHQGKH